MNCQMDLFGTLGPACDDVEILSDMLRSGMTGVRLNLSHIRLVDASEQLSRLRQASERTGIACKLLIDLQGPELRIGSLSEPLELAFGELIPARSLLPFPEEVLDYLTAGQQVLLDDGNILLEMQDSTNAKVLRGGTLSGRKSVALPGVEIRMPALTETDLENLSHAVQFGVTGVMQPFVRSKDDLISVRSALDKVGGQEIRLYAKIESQDGVEKLPEMLPYADEFVIARGDLGNAVTLFRLPAVQKRISQMCRSASKPFMVVTQMLASMEHHPVPTRAEVNDIFNSVVDGTSSVMVTGETAVGDYPVETISCLSSVVKEAEHYLQQGTESL